MLRKTIRSISIIMLVAFTTGIILPQRQTFAASNTGTIKIFSEVKGIEIFIDEQSKGMDMAVLNDIEVGSHYVKATKNGVTIFSELVNVNANATTTMLIKDTGQVKEKIIDSMYKQQQEYKAKKLDILISKGSQTEGTSQTYGNYYPGYYSIFGPTWTTTSTSTQYETTDWKVIQGGVQEISDVTFAALVKDKDALQKNSDAWDRYNNTIIWAGVVGLLGICMAIAGFAAPASDSAAAVGAVGIAAAVIGCGIVLSLKEPGGHLISAGDAARKAYQYNQKLKADLGLPENYEPR